MGPTNLWVEMRQPVGEKGARRTEIGAAAAAALLGDLSALGPVQMRPMFGGHGLFVEGVMFALVDSSGGCFLRVGPSNVAPYDAAGSAAHGRMPYRRIPETVRADDRQLLEWARLALHVAGAAKRRTGA